MPSQCPPAELTPTPGKWSLRLYRALYRIRVTEALNCGQVASIAGSAPAPDHALAANLKRAINRVKAEAIHPATGQVDYDRLKTSDTFQDYRGAVRALRDFDPSSLAEVDERKAFWINLYNALIVHAVIAYGVRRTITEVGGIFERAAYIVGGCRFSADDIEHGILRANAGHPALPGARFRTDDPRRAFALTSLDPRIHFVLNCGAASCPPIGFYDAALLDQQFDLAARHFTQHGVIVDREHQTVQLSRIFSWYAGDFGGVWFGYRNRAALLRGIAPYVAGEADRALLRERSAGWSVSFLAYDWTLNQ